MEEDREDLVELKGLAVEELQAVFSTSGAFSKAAAVIRIYQGDEEGRWRYAGQWGMVFLVYEKSTSSHHLRLFDLKTKQQIWTQEMFFHFHYHVGGPSFHFFEAHDSVIGFAFAANSDAQKFAEAVQANTPEWDNNAVVARKFRKTERESVGAEQPVELNNDAKPVKSARRKSGFLSRFIKKESASEGQSASLGQEISWPKDVKHELHIGWDPLKGFEIRNIPPEWKKLFKAAGVSKSELEDAETARFVMETIATATASNEDQVPAPPAPPAPPGPGGLAAAMQVRLRGASSTISKTLKLPNLSLMDEKEGEGLASTLALAMQARREALGNGSEEERSQWTDDEA